MSFITLENISHHYFSQTGYTKAVEDVQFSIKKGEFVSLIGPSGCGKSTILSMIAGLMKQTEGHISVNNTPLTESSLSIGYMLQQDYLFPWKTIMENILLGPKITHNLKEETYEKARKLLDEVHLLETENHFPQSLSGGMRQRIALVRTLITDPDILLFDEPFSALDYVTKLKLENIVAKLTNLYHKTTILVTHDLGEAISMSDKIILMTGTPGTISKTFTVPQALREETPFLVRRHSLYQELFDEIWKSLNQDQVLFTDGDEQHETNH